MDLEQNRGAGKWGKCRELMCRVKYDAAAVYADTVFGPTKPPRASDTQEILN